MYRLVGISHFRALQLTFPRVQLRQGLKATMDSKQEDIQQPIGKQPDPKEVRQFATVTHVEGENRE